MKKKTVVFLIILLVVCISILSLCAFYLTPFIKANNLIVYVNKNGVVDSEEAVWVSNSNLQSLQIVDDNRITDDIFISIKTKNNLSSLSWNRISFLCNISAVAHDLVSNEKVAEYQQCREITFEFSNFKWVVVDVK